MYVYNVKLLYIYIYVLYHPTNRNKMATILYINKYKFIHIYSTLYTVHIIYKYMRCYI